MSKLLKFLATLVLLLVVAAVLAPFLIDSDDFKSRVESAFTDATGRQLVIAGHLRISLAPRPALEVTDVSVPGAFGTRGPALVEADRVRLYPRLSPLLRGRLVLGSVRVKGGRLEWIRDGQGKTDRDDRPYSRWLAIDDLEGVAGPIGAGEPVAFHLNGLVGGRDGESPARLRAEGKLVIADPRQPRLDALTIDLQGLQLRKGLAADLALHTSLDADLVARRYLTDGLALDVHAFGKALAGGRIEAKAGARVELDLGAGSLEVSDFRARSGALSATGAARGRGLSSTPLVEGNLVVDEMDLRTWLGQQGLPIPPMADAETFRRFYLSTRWLWKGDRYGLEDLVVRVDQTRLTGEAERIATSPPGYRFDLVADRMDLDRYLPPSQRKRAKFTRGQRMPKAASEPAVSKGPVAEHPSSERPSSGTQPSSGIGTGTSAAAPLPVLAKVSSPMGTISEPDLEGRLHVGDLVLARLRFGDVDLGLRGKEGRLDIRDQIQSFYGGRLDGSLGLDLDDAQPSLALKQHADGIRMGPLLADLVGEERLTGRGRITADLRASGRRANALRRSLAGNLTLEVPKGVIEGINLETLVREADARLNGRPPPEDLPTSTDFEDLRASGQIERGVLHNEDLILHTDYLRVTGAGTLDLVQERFDYRFEPVLVKPPKGRGIKELEGIPIPVHLTGTFAHPRWDVDLSKALRAAAQRRLGEQGGTLFHELEKRTHIKGLEQGLKSLLGQ